MLVNGQILISWKTLTLLKKDCRRISKALRKYFFYFFYTCCSQLHCFSTFEQYASEIETGKLEWSPPHKSDVFWKENAHKLEEHNYQLLRSLARLLSTSNSTLVLSVGASDVGYYIKFASKGGKK